MNWPNILTLSRFGFGLAIAWTLLLNSLSSHLAAAVLFIIASLTDYYDGYLAKKHNLISDFGKIMDPIADKFMVLLIFAVLAVLGMMDWWMVCVIAVREIAVTVSRLRAMLSGRVIAAEKAGKIKTVLQIASIAFVLLFLIGEQSAAVLPWFYRYELSFRFFINILLWAAVVATLLSGWYYFKTLNKDKR